MNPHPRPYIVHTEPVPNWSGALYNVFAVAIDGRKEPVGRVRTDDGQLWRQLDTTTRQPTGIEYGTAEQAADAMVADAYAAQKKEPSNIPYSPAAH